MNAHTEIVASPLAKMREPFPANQISKLPKPTAKRDIMDKLPKAKCPDCGQYHATSKVIHLDYVGHAALTDRLLDTDPEWSWEPVAYGPDGLPKLDQNGGLWIRLTVLGVTRLGYGDAEGKQGGNAIKEAIGDALRNAAMRFGAALDLWHKGDLHIDEDGTPSETRDNTPAQPRPDDIEPAGGWGDWARDLIQQVGNADTDGQLDDIKNDPANKARINAVKKIDKTMFNAIGEAFAARRQVLADEVPF